MGFRRVLSTAATAAAHAAGRLSHGLVFVAGGLMTLADHHRLATGAHENALSGAEDAMAGLNPTEERAYRQVVRPGAQLCVIGGGSGRDVLPFVTRGHEVVAVDPDRDALATLTRLLRARELSAVVVPGFAEDVALPGTFDAVILSPHCYSYVPGSSRRVALLDKLRTHLNPGGRIAINYLCRHAEWTSTGVRIAAAVGRLTRSDCPWEPHDTLQLAHGPRGRCLLFEHHFHPEEVWDEARRAGLQRRDADTAATPGLAIVGP